MYDLAIRRLARDLAADGIRGLSIARRLGVGQSTVSRWLRLTFVSDSLDHARSPCPLGRTADWSAAEREDYLYLLGQYLGDGSIVRRPRTFLLTIYACLDYPVIQHEIVRSLTTVTGRAPALRVRPEMTERMVGINSC